jgi:hypothetical protein
MRNQLIGLLGALALLLLSGLQPARAQGGAYGEQPSFFEGTITYSFKATGQAKWLLRTTNPIKYMRMHIRKGDYIVHLFGDNDFQQHDRNLLKPFPTTRLFLADSNRLYSLDMDQGVAYKHEIYNNPMDTPPVAKPIGDTIEVKGYECAGYRYIKPRHKHKYRDDIDIDPADTVTLYVSDSVRADMAYYKGKTNATAAFLTQGLAGRIPLKMIRHNPERKIVVTAQTIKGRDLSKKQFRIPPSVEVIDRMDNRR